MNRYFIKNMVCPRCIESVQQIFIELNIPTQEIKLGFALTKAEIPLKTRILLETKLAEKGFQLLENNVSKLVNQVKTIIINEIHYPVKAHKTNFSVLLSENLNQQYSYLSRLFSLAEGITIEKFIVKQKIEKVKELLFYKELTLSEISSVMEYSSVSHLSNQFKKETGITPTQYKNLKSPQRKNLDSL